jgi:hypothetical protein
MVHSQNKWGRRGGYLGEELHGELQEWGWPKVKITDGGSGIGEGERRKKENEEEERAAG